MSIRTDIADRPEVSGHCPWCGSETLRLVDTEILCASTRCQVPGSAQEILSDPEREHIVTFAREGFTVRHPLRERLGDALMQCDVHDRLVSGGGSYLPDGRYRVFVHFLEYDGVDVRFEPLEGHLVLGPVEGDQDVYPGS